MPTERMTQNRVIRLLRDILDYTYLGDLHDKNNSNIDEALLKKHLKKAGYSDELIRRAVNDLVISAKNSSKILYDLNKDIYSMLRYGHSIKLSAGEQSKTVHFIDWKTPGNNDFYVAEEVTIFGENTKRPDIVIYINGIAIAVLELKRSSVSVSQGIRQNLDNQKDVFIKNFFATIQLCLAGNDTEGLRYGVIETKEKYYLQWKEDENVKDGISLAARKLMDSKGYKIDNHLIALLYPERLIDIIYNFIVFDGGDKKTCRPHQYFGVLAAKARMGNKEGGVIWHMNISPPLSRHSGGA